ncbi:MAG: hypothetical protein ACREAE_09985 [Nitrosopumilaceae archaeon]
MVADVANLVNTSILIGIIVGVFFAGIGGAYAIFAASNNSDNTMNQNSDLMKQMIGEMTRHHQAMESMMMNNMTQQNMAGQGMMGNNMDSDATNQSTESMVGSGNMMSGMMNQVPKDVIVKVTSSQKVSAGKEAEIVLLVLDKESEKPLVDAQVIIGIERGSSMSTMDMMGGMFDAENIGSGKYVVRFTPDNEGVYTLHTHVIPAGKAMHSMMENHLDVGIIAE